MQVVNDSVWVQPDPYAPLNSITWVYPSTTQASVTYEVRASESSNLIAGLSGNNWNNAMAGMGGYSLAATGSSGVTVWPTIGWYTYQNEVWQCHQSGQVICYSCDPETAEEKAARLKREEEHEAKRKAASLRAESLLFTILTPQQVRQYTDDNYFDVVIDNRTYRIKKGYSRNIELIEGGKPTALYCAHPADAYSTPVPDAMLAQLLMLRGNEQEFLRIANRTALR
jgi:hypothetical protein